jgi:hypothetical protein
VPAPLRPWQILPFSEKFPYVNPSTGGIDTVDGKWCVQSSGSTVTADAANLVTLLLQVIASNTFYRMLMHPVEQLAYPLAKMHTRLPFDGIWCADINTKGLPNISANEYVGAPMQKLGYACFEYDAGVMGVPEPINFAKQRIFAPDQQPVALHIWTPPKVTGSVQFFSVPPNPGWGPNPGSGNDFYQILGPSSAGWELPSTIIEDTWNNEALWGIPADDPINGKLDWLYNYFAYNADNLSGFSEANVWLNLIVQVIAGNKFTMRYKSPQPGPHTGPYTGSGSVPAPNLYGMQFNYVSGGQGQSAEYKAPSLIAPGYFAWMYESGAKSKLHRIQFQNQQFISENLVASGFFYYFRNKYSYSTQQLWQPYPPGVYTSYASLGFYGSSCNQDGNL